jgi:hypothetical protein
MLTQIQQCLAFHPRPFRRRYVHHVGDNVPRTAPPAHLATTKRPTSGTKPRALGCVGGEDIHEQSV